MSLPTDEVVQATNDDATASKAHAVSRGYWKDPYIHFFCSNVVAKAPEISRGYFVRTTTFRTVAVSFVKNLSSCCQIVNLGAGSDTLYFYLRDVDALPSVYVEIDLKFNVTRKAAQIKRRKLLPEDMSVESKSEGDIVAPTNASGTPLQASSCHYNFDSGRFRLLSFDLRNPVEELVDMLSNAGCANDLPTLFLAECVLVYMPTHKSSQLLQGLSTHFPRSAFLHYEQVNMEDQFGTVMINNFRARSCELPGLGSCQSLASQEQRFIETGWKTAKAWTINEVYRSLPPNTRRHIERVEMLDDLEIAGQLFDHYCILLATTDPNLFAWTELREPLTMLDDQQPTVSPFNIRNKLM